MNDCNDLWIYTLPVSGGGFVTQLGLLCELYEARKICNNGKCKGRKSYAPDLVLAASGGNVSSYLALSGDWSTPGIYRGVYQLDPKAFTRKWVPRELSIVPNIAIGVCKGSLYRKGYGACDLFTSLFTPKSVSSTEIWTGTYNNDLKSAQFFCNKRRDNSMINEVFFNEEQFLFDSLKLQFMNENIELISKVTIASASIPLIVPNQVISGTSYADGGCMYPSPLPVFINEIVRIVLNDTSLPRTSKLYYKKNEVKEEILNVWQDERTFTVNIDGSYEKEIYNSPVFIGNKNKSKNLRLVYFMPYQADRICLKKQTDFEKETDVISQILHAAMLRDRNTAIDILYRLCSSVSYTFFPEMTTRKLAALLKKLSCFKHYVLCLSPHGHPHIALTHFTPNEIMEKIEQTRHGYSVSIWYSHERLGNSNNLDNSPKPSECTTFIPSSILSPSGYSSLLTPSISELSP